jgi:hypothetical protein
VIAAQELDFSDAELTLMAFIMDEEYFPATPPPALDDDGWKAVERGLVARGVVHGRLRQRVADDVAEVLDVVLSADRSLWLRVAFAPGVGESHAHVLWLRDDAVVRLTAPPVGPKHLVVCDRKAIDDSLAALVDFPTAAGSQPGEPVSLPIGDFADAMQLASEESSAAAATRYPAAADFVAALADARCTTIFESRRSIGSALGDQRIELLTFAESPSQGLWLAHDDPYDTTADLSSEQTHVRRVSIEMARDVATTLALAPG